MGNSVSAVVGQCCHRSQQDLQFGSKLPMTTKQPKIDIVLEKPDKPQQTMHESDFQESAQKFYTTVSTNLDQAPLSKCSKFAPMAVDQEQVRITISEQKHMRVPFNVILLTLSEQLMKVMNHNCEELLGRFMEESPQAPCWRLTKKGHYVSVINPTFISLFAEKMFYEGEVMADGNDAFTPDNVGVLATEEGIYKGSFCEGKAHGTGTFIEAATKTVFKGEWNNGEFMHGSIQNEIVKYTGQMKNSHAEGKGKLIFKKEIMEYVGWFKGGKYDGDGSVLKCELYTYQGNFREGKKSGRGVLMQKEQKIQLKMGSTKIKKYIPPSTMTGQWENDNISTIISQDLSKKFYSTV